MQMFDNAEKRQISIPHSILPRQQTAALLLRSLQVVVPIVCNVQNF